MNKGKLETPIKGKLNPVRRKCYHCGVKLDSDITVVIRLQDFEKNDRMQFLCSACTPTGDNA